MAKKILSAPEKLKQFLIVVLVVVTLGGGALFYFALENVRTFATEVSHTVTDADASGDQVQALQALKGQLAQSESLITKANQIFATPDNYQAQSITDIRQYAAMAGLTVERTSFGEELGGDTRTVTVSLQAPVSYSKLIRFIDALEGNVPKMQISSITLEHVPGSGADTVKVSDIVLMIAVR